MDQQQNNEGLVLPPLHNRHHSTTSQQQHVTQQRAASSDDDDNNNNIGNDNDDDDQHTPSLNSLSNNSNNEIFNDGTNQWVPIHLLKRKKGKVWTHFFAINKNLNTIKCKHCLLVLENFNQQSNNPNKLLERHLRIKHHLNPFISYYDMQNINSQDNNNNNINNININNPTSNLTKIIALLMASQNLSIDFINDPIIKLLFNKNDSLSLNKNYYFPNQNLIKLTIKNLSLKINNIIKRTYQRNIMDSNLIIDINNNSNNNNNDLIQRSGFLEKRLNSFLLELQNLTLFSLQSNIINNNINIIILQFYDSFNKIIKTLPLNIKLSNSIDKHINTITLRNQLSTIFNNNNNNKNMEDSILSITLSQNNFNNLSNLNDFKIFKNNNYHLCLIDILSNSIKSLFFQDNNNNNDHHHHHHQNENQSLLDPLNTMFNFRHSSSNNNNNNNNRPKNFYSNDKESHFLDSCINLSNWDQSNQSLILNKINEKITNFYNELNLNPWQSDNFNQLYKKKFNVSEDPIWHRFDKLYYSTIPMTLKQLLNLKSIILTVQESLHIDCFNDKDFQTIEILVELFQSFNKLIIYFGSAKKLNFTYIIFTIITLENQISALIQMNNKLLIHDLQNLLNQLTIYKDQLIKDDINLLALLLCPAVIFDRNLLELVYKTTSISDIVNIQTETIKKILKRFITIEFINDNNNQDHLNSQYFNGNENKIIEDEIDLILNKIINDDLYQYLTTADKIIPLSYQTYCERSGYIRHSNLFRRRNDNDEDERMSHVDQLLDIHIPVCNAFWDQYSNNDAGLIIKLLIKFMLTESSTSKKIDYEFLNGFIPKLGNDYLNDVVKIKLFNEQFAAGKVDYDIDTLNTAATYNN